MRVLIIIGCFLAATSGAGAAVLHIGTVSGVHGGEVAAAHVSLVSSAGEQVAALQYELVYDADAFAFTHAAAGPAAEQAGKSVLTNVLSPSRVRCIVSGFNRNVIANGEVCTMTLSAAEGIADGAYVLDLENVILSDPEGRPVPVSARLGVILTGDAHFHSSDVNEDWVISVSELLRVVQLYNWHEFYCGADTEDGYDAGPGSRDCRAHDSDFRQPQWSINVSELLRLIQLYNLRAYHVAPETEDGFAPGPFTRGAS